ncbi:hypothetical protein C8Q80DRAFT_434169 [Daedaleopsis nitida]|nr:hypothetical protein C8Q80DRAFT_434169 [Daedaleopsis nitida]
MYSPLRARPQAEHRTGAYPHVSLVSRPPSSSRPARDDCPRCLLPPDTLRSWCSRATRTLDRRTHQSPSASHPSPDTFSCRSPIGVRCCRSLASRQWGPVPSAVNFSTARVNCSVATGLRVPSQAVGDQNVPVGDMTCECTFFGKWALSNTVLLPSQPKARTVVRWSTSRARSTCSCASSSAADSRQQESALCSSHDHRKTRTAGCISPAPTGVGPVPSLPDTFVSCIGCPFVETTYLRETTECDGLRRTRSRFERGRTVPMHMHFRGRRRARTAPIRALPALRNTCTALPCDGLRRTEGETVNKCVDAHALRQGSCSAPPHIVLETTYLMRPTRHIPPTPPSSCAPSTLPELAGYLPVSG